MAEMLDAIAEFAEGMCPTVQRDSDFDALAKVETLQRRLLGKIRKRSAIIAHHAAEIAAQRGDGYVIADVQRGQLLRKIVPVGIREHPLREIVGKSFGQEMMAAQCLKRVMK